jgi:hypothetical protein
MKDPIVPKPAEISIQQEATRQHKLIPIHAQRTLEKWDKYRAEEREKLSHMTEKEQVTEYMAAAIPAEHILELARAYGIKGDLPENKYRDEITEIKRNEAIDDAYAAGGTPAVVEVSLEAAFDRKLIGPLEFRWRKLLRRLVGTLKRKGSFGAPSAPPTPGTEKTE